MIEEAKPLLEKHWREIAVHQDIPLDPEYSLYDTLGDSGLMVCYTIRDDSRSMVGYAVFFIRPHMHYRGHVWAINDIIWLHPDFRRLGVGRDFVRFIEADLRSRKVDVVHINGKVAHPALIVLLRSEGYVIVGTELEKRL